MKMEMKRSYTPWFYKTLYRTRAFFSNFFYLQDTVKYLETELQKTNSMTFFLWMTKYLTIPIDIGRLLPRKLFESHLCFGLAYDTD